MIIVLGGFLGSGRQLLAREIAKKYGVKLYKMKQHLLARGYRNAAGQYGRYTLPSRTDEDRMRVYKLALKDFPMLSKQYDTVIIERAFSSALREDFLTQVRKYFDPVVFVWVESDDVSARKFIQRMARKRLLRSVEQGLQARESQRKEFQPFLKETPIFHNHPDRKRAADELWQMIQELAQK